MAAALGFACLWGSPASAAELPKGAGALERAMASAQVNRPSTLAGALDAYAKGFLFDNGVYLAMVSDGGEQARLYQQMRESGSYSVNGTEALRLPDADVPFFLDSGLYYILGLAEEGDGYRCWVAMPCQSGDGDRILLHRVTVTRDPQYGWLVRQTAERLESYDSDSRVDLLPGHRFAVETEEWSFTSRWVTYLCVDNLLSTERTFWGDTVRQYDSRPNLQARFSAGGYENFHILTLKDPGEGSHYLFASGVPLSDLPADLPPASAGGAPVPGQDFSFSSSGGGWSFGRNSGDGFASGGGGSSGDADDSFLPAAMQVSVQVDGVHYGPYILTPEVTE